MVYQEVFQLWVSEKSKEINRLSKKILIAIFFNHKLRFYVP